MAVRCLALMVDWLMARMAGICEGLVRIYVVNKSEVGNFKRASLREHAV